MRVKNATAAVSIQSCRPIGVCAIHTALMTLNTEPTILTIFDA